MITVKIETSVREARGEGHHFHELQRLYLGRIFVCWVLGFNFFLCVLCFVFCVLCRGSCALRFFLLFFFLFRDFCFAVCVLCVGVIGSGFGGLELGA